ncbi:hypothetical protein NQZ68_034829 [Dissostichus eleginoides]|nr:hypothetical protein NQZ68_034829 [Dissostichus eleginoides]
METIAKAMKGNTPGVPPTMEGIAPPDWLGRTPGRGLGGPASFHCHNCGKPGHYQRDCRSAPMVGTYSYNQQGQPHRNWRGSTGYRGNNHRGGGRGRGVPNIPNMTQMPAMAWDEAAPPFNQQFQDYQAQQYQDPGNPY